MITYLYWLLIFGLVAGILYLVWYRFDKRNPAIIAAAVVLVLGAGAYYFHFQQIFVKRFGGVMSIKVPPGEQHIAATWKDDNLWIENYNPAKNTCLFREYSRGNMLQGKVIIENCNPLQRSR